VVYIIYPTDEKRIIKIVSKIEEAAVSEDIDKVMDFISFNYSDDNHNGYIQIKQIILTGFRRLDDIEIERNIEGISIIDNVAESELSFRVIASFGDERGYIIGDAARKESIKVFFEKSAQRWFITKIEGVFNKNIYY
jgi:hypothetical protein